MGPPRRSHFFMIEYKDEKKRIFFDGVEVASFSARYPSVEGLDAINSFLLTLVSNSLSFFLGALCERAREEYDNDTSDKKRFYFKAYRYTLNIEAEEREENELSVSLDASLCRGKKQELSHFFDSFSFDTEKQIIKKTPKENKKKGI